MVRILRARPLTGHRLEVTFDDGLKGIFAVEPARRGGVFLRLLDPQLFNAVTVNADFGCVEWPGGIDLDPDTMHNELTGSKTLHNEAAVLREGKEGK